MEQILSRSILVLPHCTNCVSCSLTCFGKVSVKLPGVIVCAPLWTSVLVSSWDVDEALALLEKWISGDCSVTDFYMTCLWLSAWWPLSSPKLILKSITEKGNGTENILKVDVWVLKCKEEPLKEPFRAYVQWQKLVVQMCYSDWGMYALMVN